ncbi:DGQHR domain-containing protein [Sphingomonas sp. PP-CE-3A-406]|uniref:DGQHR domain-containing protein n=1 Tax=Sphingomonas sp. PP-CE-3A-406 TaxID=2135659 RepID=UPI000EF9D06B|nr:DGQHR domain-containing protein [Sphingomonas sp. PP-CE-3A-406]RMB51570.1 DGQHR domain-containing protein [Sphingomonas sp. PP-CE-3A-406]
MSDQKFTAECIPVELGGVTAYTFAMPVKDLVHIYYVAVRGRDDEEGAVQRPLNTRRIQSIKDYILEGNTFFNSFILNWTDASNKVVVKNNKISFSLVSAAAQAIDGQHRLAGLEDAMEDDSSVGGRVVIVTLCIGLTTKHAATIFLNINTEQRPVPKSLLFDLFGETGNDPNHAINRARDIANQLNDEPKSPLYNLIKFPGAPRGAGKIELSTFVTALKKGFEPDGEFPKRKLKSLDHQATVVSNYFSAIKNAYVTDKTWASSSQNPFFKAAGFNGAIDFLLDKLIFKCAERGSFSVQAITEILGLSSRELLRWEDLQGQDGKTARKNVYQYLEKGMSRVIDSKDAYAF